ncbi:MAG: UvrD-helicase domain-containing protein [Clostridiales bacterium]|nr:UvrD-helicase domain-containing protein [Clostridiales bacterium]
MGNREIAEQRADEIDAVIIDTLKSGKSFRVEAGAGAGKTHSLMRAIEWLEKEKHIELKRKGQRVACITYTNVAVDEIKSRLKSEGFIRPCTIHNFAWEFMSGFQSTLISTVEELNLLPVNEEKTGNDSIKDVKKVLYDLGARYIEDGELHIHHDDVIKLFVKLLDNAKFRMLLSNEYPIILIDEYQDSFRTIMDQFLRYFIEPCGFPQIGLFGDAWQTIYGENGACGEVISENLVVIKKESNFRSQKVIVNALNRIRPDLPQISASDENDGRIIVVTTNDYTGSRQTKNHYKGELPNDIMFTYIDNVRKKLAKMGWAGDCKTLMLTHKLLSKQQHYDNLLDFLEDHLRDADDEHFLFFMNKVEPVYAALKNNDAKGLFDALGVERGPIQSIENKRQWKMLGKELETARQGTIYQVLKVLEDSRLLGLPPKIAEKLIVFDRWTEGEDLVTLYGKPIKDFYEISYKEVINVIGFQKPDAEYSTDHGVKGEEFENVILIMGRGWNNYKFDEALPINPILISDEKQMKAYIRNRNLFYVCCSRAKKRLAIFITFPVNGTFKTYLESVFGVENIMTYGDFMRIMA